MPPEAPVTSAVIPERSNILSSVIPAKAGTPARPRTSLSDPGFRRGDASASDFLHQRIDVVHRDDARHPGIGRDALDHGAEHLAAELDEMIDSGLGHGGDAFAP